MTDSLIDRLRFYGYAPIPHHSGTLPGSRVRTLSQEWAAELGAGFVLGVYRNDRRDGRVVIHVPTDDGEDRLWPADEVVRARCCPGNHFLTDPDEHFLHHRRELV